ncbi:nuclear pore complex protein Nup153 isoform 2-T2 [Polymixia lowei]
MAATGGGKIRSRRYHIASKPYAKSKQQPGLISRVTDTVKSIVPSWLQKYFNSEEVPEGEGVVRGTEQNRQPPPPNCSEEGPPPLDGWDPPEPSTSNTEPSTSRASLNFQDNVLSRPPLNRSHLHFPPLDASSPVLGASSSLFSQPSTSSAPGPFSTGFSLVKEIKDNLSQHEDDNISTTSGFSSRASDKDVPTSKTASIPRLWSPEPQPAQSSLKKPAFNLSVFGMSSNTTLNSTVLNSSQLGDSPFYPGKTTYGGAASVRSSRTRPSTPYQAPLRRQIKAKPAGAQPCGVTSATARRILQSLERMSSPLADAKRIPSVASSPMSVSMDGTNLDFSHLQSKKKRLDSPLPPVQKLVIPAAASVSGNRSVSFRPSLTPGGVGRTLDRTPRDTPTRQSPHIPEATPGPSQSTTSSSGPAYPLSSTPAASSTGSGGGKMKRERTSTRPSSKRPEDDTVAEVPDLPAISLPISTFSLPTFSFSSPTPTTSVTPVPAPSTTPMTPAKELVVDKEPPAASMSPCVPFTFSSPIVKATAASPPSFSPSAGFTFSAPVAKMGPSMSNGKLSTPMVAAVKSTTSNSTDDFEGPFKPAKTLKQGSVLDLLKAPGFASSVARSSPGPDTAPPQSSTDSTAPSSTSTTISSSTGFGNLFKPPTGSWNCDVCLVQNKPSDTKCVACMSPQPKSSSSKPPDNKPTPATSVGLENSKTTTTTSTTSTGFGTMFATPAGTWECDTCLVQNKPEVVKCVACETAKPGTGVKPSLTLPSAFSAVKTVSTLAAPASTGFTGFGDKFTKAEGAWVCDTCMVDNKAQDTKCVACMSAKPGASARASSSSAPASSAPLLGFGDKFKKPEGAWDCDVCCVQNKAADVQCVACQTAKPGVTVEPKAFGSSSFGNSGSSSFGASGSGGFKFGSSSDSTSGSGGFKFGGNLSESSSTSSSDGFKFGVLFGNASSETTSKDASGSSGFKFGSSTEGLQFGATSTPATAGDDKKADPTTMGSGFKFGDAGGIVFGAGTSSTESKPAMGGFSFGLSKPDEKTSATTVTASTVTFTLPASSQEKNVSGTLSTDTMSTSTTTTTTSTGSVFGRLGEPSLTTAPLGGSTFVSLSTEKEPAAPTFTFGKPEEKKEAASSAPSSFLFSAASKEAGPMPAPATLGGFSFSKPDPPKEQPPPTFSFGKPADKSETPAPEVPKPTFAFGQSATETSAAPKPAFTFNATTTSSSTPATSLFGSSSTQAPAPTATPAPSTFVFGQTAPSSSDAPPAKTFLFGQSQDSQSPAPSATSMNSTPASTATPAPAQPFLFGPAVNAAPAAAPSFTFGGATPSAASSAAPSAAPSPFVFSSAPSGGFGANQTPSFGSAFGSPAPSPFTATASQTPAFGAKPNAAPVFGQQANSTPVFGAAANSTPGGGFQFGGASAFGASSNNTGVFAFGAGAAASPSSSAPPSMAPQPAAPGGGFNFVQPPAFNIGSTKSSFVPSPAGQQTIAGRKIKTAVRRRK